MHTITTKLFLLTILATGILAAWPEPFEMDSRAHEIIEDHAKAQNQRGSQDPIEATKGARQTEVEKVTGTVPKSYTNTDSNNSDNDRSSNSTEGVECDRSPDTDQR